MSNLLNFALGGLTGATTGSPLTTLFGAAGATILKPTAPAASPLASRDSQMPQLSTILSSVNLLGQLAGSQSSGSADLSAGDSSQQLQVPPSPPMPAPAKPAQVATDDHGQSNIVFSDADSDAALIH